MQKRFEYAMDIGEQMLLSGAEIYRVEDAVHRMCEAFGAKRVDVFIITSSMIVTVHDEKGESFTQTRRITASKMNMEKLHRLNHLSRAICRGKLSDEEIEERLQEAASCGAYPLWLEFFACAAIAGAFTLFFGGGFGEAGVSFLVGALVWLLVFFSERLLSKKIFSNFYASALVTLLAYMGERLGWIPTMDRVIIGNIMTLIPGIGLTNAIRDLFVGDSIAGLLRLVDALLNALAIAAGYYLIAVLGGFFL